MSWKVRWRERYQEYEAYVPAGFFIAGFVFDIATLGRIDDFATILSQAIYLSIIAIYARLELRDASRAIVPHRWCSWFWTYRQEIVHFLFGSLLSAYTLFYLKSSSLVASGLFLLLMVALMLANEFSRFQQSGVLMRVGLLSLSLISYFGYIIPMVFGFVGLIPFLVAVLLSILTMWLLLRGLESPVTEQSGAAMSAEPEIQSGVRNQEGDRTDSDDAFLKTSASGDRSPSSLREAAHNRLRAWRAQPLITRAVHVSRAVAALFLVLYMMRLVPPVPLSAQYMGIYHSVEKVDGSYRVSFHRPWWKKWQNGAQTFLARPGDRVFVFARVFSPLRFQDEIRVRWLYKDRRTGWQSADSIPIQISGGREEGFRGFAYKQNWVPGDWRVQLETTDGREIGRIGFSVVIDSSDGPRIMETESF